MSVLGHRSQLLLMAVCVFSTAVSYESVYDIIERRNQRRNFNEPDGRYFEARESFLNRYDDYNPYPTFNTGPGSIYSSVRRPVYTERSYRVRGRLGGYGNGYDNIGNGFAAGRDGERQHFYRESPFDRKPHGDYWGFGRQRSNEYPIYYDRQLYVRPRHDERSFRYGNNNGNNYDSSSGDRGNTAVSSVDAVIANSEDSKQRDDNENYRVNQGSVRNDSSDRENLGEKSRVDRNGENKSTVHTNRVSKKGHVTKGFSNHHHKDETGNSTTFYNEFSDHGGQSDFKGVDDGFSERKTLEQFSNTEKDKSYKENGGQSGNYGSGFVKDNRKTVKDITSNSNHFDRGEKFHSSGENDRLGNRGNFYRHEDGGYGEGRGLPYDNYNVFF